MRQWLLPGREDMSVAGKVQNAHRGMAAEQEECKQLTEMTSRPSLSASPLTLLVGIWQGRLQMVNYNLFCNAWIGLIAFLNPGLNLR